MSDTYSTARDKAADPPPEEQLIRLPEYHDASRQFMARLLRRLATESLDVRVDEEGRMWIRRGEPSASRSRIAFGPLILHGMVRDTLRRLDVAPLPPRYQPGGCGDPLAWTDHARLQFAELQRWVDDRWHSGTLSGALERREAALQEVESQRRCLWIEIPQDGAATLFLDGTPFRVDTTRIGSLVTVQLQSPVDRPPPEGLSLGMRRDAVVVTADRGMWATLGGTHGCRVHWSPRQR